MIIFFPGMDKCQQCNQWYKRSLNKHRQQSPLKLPANLWLFRSSPPFSDTCQASDWPVVDNNASHVLLDAFISALLYMPSLAQAGWFSVRRHPPPTELRGCFEKRHQWPDHRSHHLLVVGVWGFVGYWFSASRDCFHNWLKWPGAERESSLLKTISQPRLELSQARGCSDAFQPQPDWQQLGVSEPSSACAPHKHP